jgi:HJR/Mrr/RecB family endonuclease
MVAVAIYWAFASSYSSKQIIIHPAIELQSDLEKRLRDFKKIEDRLAAIRLREHMSYWLNLSGWQFEKEVSNLYKKQGFNSLVTKGSGDGGVDIVLNKDGVKTLVQCKNHNKAIGPASIRDLFGAMTHEGVSSGIFISSTGYTKGAREFSLGKSIALLDIHDIIRMHNQF